MKRTAKRTGASTGRQTPVSPGVKSAVQVRRHGDYLTASLCAPHGNRVSAEMAAALIELVREIDDDDSVKQLVLTCAAGEFCTGFDLGVDPRVVESLAALGKPNIALINGV